MLSVSAAYAAAITANIEETFFKGSFEVEPVGIKEHVSAAATSSLSIFSKPEQTYDTTEELNYKYASFEKNRFPLDGSAVVYDEEDENQHGWWGDTLSNENGVWEMPEVLTFTFSQDYDLIGITIFFDNKFKEWAEDFSVAFYDSSDVLLESSVITGNQKVSRIVDLMAENVRKVEISISKWSFAGVRRAKVAEVFFGQKFILNDENVLSFSLAENASILEDNLPANEMEITVENTNEMFNPVNPSGIIKYLRQKMPISANLGVKLADGSIEYVDCGQYWLYEFPTSTEEYKAKLVARSPAGFLEDTYHPMGFGTATATEIAQDIFSKAGILNYSIDSSFDGVTLNQYIEPSSYAAALQYLANACCGYVKQGRDGYISLLPVPVTDTAGLNVGYDKMTEKPGITQTSKYTGVEVTYHAWTYDEYGEVCEYGCNINGQTKTITLDYNSPAYSVSASIAGGTIGSATYYTDEVVLTITGTADETVVTLNGYKMSDTTATCFLDNSDAEYDDVTNTLDVDNPFIYDLSTAEAVAAAYVANMDFRLAYEFPWRGDMRLEGGDIIETENDFSNQNIVVTKNVFAWENGILSGQISGKGEII